MVGRKSTQVGIITHKMSCDTRITCVHEQYIDHQWHKDDTIDRGVNQCSLQELITHITLLRIA